MVELWSIKTSGPYGTFLKAASLIRQLNAKGINPLHFRSVLDAENLTDPLVFSLVQHEAFITDGLTILPDFLVWGWVPLLSARAKELMKYLGAPDADFVPCQMDIESESRFMHIPTSALDGVDVKRSSFQMILPGSNGLPDLPAGLQQLIFDDRTEFPSSIHVSRVKIPSHDQVFAELVVDRNFKDDWERQNLTGAKFISLTP
jgi:hypothetical protein